MLSIGIALVLLALLGAGLVDLIAWRKGRRFRPSWQMSSERYNLHLDLASTQHRGIAIPIDDICRDRQRGR